MTDPDTLRAALAPFAAAAPAFSSHADTALVLGMGRVTAGDFRRAAEVYRNTPAEAGKQENAE